jgi:hypothetical protein
LPVEGVRSLELFIWIQDAKSDEKGDRTSDTHVLYCEFYSVPLFFAQMSDTRITFVESEVQSLVEALLRETKVEDA